jgi:hypothetical protein
MPREAGWPLINQGGNKSLKRAINGSGEREVDGGAEVWRMLFCLRSIRRMEFTVEDFRAKVQRVAIGLCNETVPQKPVSNKTPQQYPVSPLDYRHRISAGITSN